MADGGAPALAAREVDGDGDHGEQRAGDQEPGDDPAYELVGVHRGNEPILRRRAREPMTPLEIELATRFWDEVLAKRPVLFLPGRRDSVVEAHHVVPKRVLRAHYSTMPAEERWRLVWDPDNGIPVERPLHSLITVAMRRVEAGQLRPENLEFAERHRIVHLLEREVPTLRG